MRCLERNKQKIYYALYSEKTEATDSDGHFTGDYDKTYSSPVELMANISPASGNTIYAVFGTDIQYTHVLCIEDPDCPIDEYSILWVGIKPTEPHNYVVARAARSINNVRYAIRRVSESNG